MSQEERQELRLRHRREHDRRIADRIKAVLLKDKGWSYRQIAEALMIDEETASLYVQDYQDQGKLKHASGGSPRKLTEQQTQELVRHLKDHTYEKVIEICAYVLRTYGVTYSRQGMTDWLHSYGFSYKKPKPTPAKADPEKQKAFIREYQRLLNTPSEDKPIVFTDCVHPTMNTKVSYGWIHTSEDKLIATSASRTRMNIAGAVNLETMTLLTYEYQTINSKSIKDFLQKIRTFYPHAPWIHVILDRAGYHRHQEVQEQAAKLRIKLHYLPPYSPNLNPRVWKVMNEYARNNRFFNSVTEFKETIHGFFKHTWPQIAHTLVDRINDRFPILKSAFSS